MMYINRPIPPPPPLSPGSSEEERSEYHRNMIAYKKVFVKRQAASDRFFAWSLVFGVIFICLIAGGIVAGAIFQFGVWPVLKVIAIGVIVYLGLSTIVDWVVARL